MTDKPNPPTERELEEKYNDEPEYTIRVNGKEYKLNQSVRDAIRTRAEYEFEENPMFSCFWKTAHKSQYDVGQWEETIHEQGDPVLVIETEGPMVPWDRMDKLNVEMQDAGPNTGMDQDDGSEQVERDNGNGLKTIDPDAVDGPGEDTEKVIGRTHFALTPKTFEEVPSPDGEEADKIPPKPVKMGDEPALIAWIPDHPDIEHSWSAGEAICSMFNRVEWNVQVKADQPRPRVGKDASHDHWESLLGIHDCEKVAELSVSQEPPSETAERNDSSDDDKPERFKNGTAGGDNWTV